MYSRLQTLLLLSILLLTGCIGPSFREGQSSLKPSALDAVSKAVFEVVVVKPQKDSLSYEKPLPLELLPYAIRTDPYYSIGTAFAIAPNRFVTAAHVLNLDERTQFGEPLLRANDGSIFAIDRIYKYASDRDFVLFSLRDFSGRGHLPINPSPSLNERVFSVGNALGEGVVIRDGLYTSTTPEDLAGEWHWLRFSAAASPGNSGGPLLDRKGRVIGVVTMKSENENLNYALPIAEVLNTPEGVAICKERGFYKLDNMDMLSWDTLHQEFPLPMTYAELAAKIQANSAGFSEKLLSKLLQEHRNEIFPRGQGSLQLLQGTYQYNFPRLISKGKDGTWSPFSPYDTSNADLGNDGQMIYGTLGDTLFIQMKKPDNVSQETLLADSKMFMELLLKGIARTREIGPENVRITSMGAAVEKFVHTDTYGRRWLVQTWLSEFDDSKVVTFSLPIPGGCFTMARNDQTWNVDTGHIPDLKVLADFVHLSYYGTLHQWREFLQLGEMLPEAFADLDIAYDYGRSFHYRSKRLSLAYGPKLLNITEESDLMLVFGYFFENGEIRWDVSRVVVGEDKNSGTRYFVSRDVRPPEELGDRFRSGWQKLRGRQFPYDENAYFEDKQTRIATVYEDRKKERPADPALLYNVYFCRDGNHDQQTMVSSLREFIAGIEVYE
jgi:hypothetical protein